MVKDTQQGDKMKTLCAIKLAFFSGLFMVVICFGQDISPGNLREEVPGALPKRRGRVRVSCCHEITDEYPGAVWAEHLRTAECLVTLGGVAELRGKYYLAERLYNKALSIEEKALGSTDPEVVSCKLKLAKLRANDSK